MSTKINLFTPIQDTDCAMSCDFDLANLGYNQTEAFGVVRFNLHTPDGAHWRKIAIKLNVNGVEYIRRRCVDTYEYASIVGNTPEIKAVEKELCDYVCLLIGRTVRKHFNKKED